MSSSTSEQDKLSTTTTAFAFGANYFYNLGGTQLVELKHQLTHAKADPDVNDHPQDEDTTETVTAHALTHPAIWELEENSTELQQVACSPGGATHFLTSTGKVYSVGTLQGFVAPSPTRTTIPLPIPATKLSAGRHFCLALMEGGLAVCSWGAGHFGQLGHGNDHTMESVIRHPTVIEGLLPHVVGSPVKDISAGYWHAMAVTQAGRVFAWGCNRSYQCGRKNTSSTSTSSNDPPTQATPLPILLDQPCQKIAAGRSHSIALTKEGGNVYGWGSSAYGQVGGVTTSPRRKAGICPPQQVEALQKVTIVDIAAGETHTLALTGGGRVFAWGGGSDGQLGTASSPTVLFNPKPKLVGDLDFVAIEAGRQWKQQQQQQQQSSEQNTSETNPQEQNYRRSSSSAQQQLSGLPKICQIHASGNASVAVSTTGHVYTWGSNDVGSLGLPSPPDEELPFVEAAAAAQSSQPQHPTSTLRTCHSKSFDSDHNVAIPTRVDALSGYHISSIAVSATALWCVGQKRSDTSTTVSVGRTLYELQDQKRHQNVRRRSIEHSKLKNVAASKEERIEPAQESKSTSIPPPPPPEAEDTVKSASAPSVDDTDETPAKPKASRNLATMDGAIAAEDEDNDEMDLLKEQMQQSVTVFEASTASFPPMSPTPSLTSPKSKRKFSVTSPIKLLRKSLGGKQGGNNNNNNNT